MSLSGYTIQVDACSGLLTRVRDDEGIANAGTSLDTAYTQATDGCGSAPVAAALEAIREIVALQAEWAAARVQNAVDGVGQALTAYLEGDQKMADDACDVMVQAPELPIEAGSADRYSPVAVY